MNLNEGNWPLKSMESTLAEILFVLNGTVMTKKPTNRWNVESTVDSKV